MLPADEADIVERMPSLSTTIPGSKLLQALVAFKKSICEAHVEDGFPRAVTGDMF